MKPSLTTLLRHGRYLAGRVLLVLCLLGTTAAMAAVPAGQEKLFAEATLWAAAERGVTPAQVQFAPLDARLQVKPCAGAIVFDYPFANRDTVRARCKQPNWQLFLKLALRQPQNSVVASRALAAGQILSAADIELQPDFAPTAGAFTQREPVLGRQLKRSLVKGQAVLAQDIDNAMQVIRLKHAMRATDLLTEADIERVTVSRQASPASVWQGAALPLGARLARDMQAGQMLQIADLAETRQILVATANLPVGQQLNASLFKLEPIEQDKLTRSHLFSTVGLEGQELTRAMRAGEALRSTDLRPALMVKKGELVLFSVGQSTDFQVSVRLEALQDGRLGEQIKLRNTESGRTLSGIVSGQNAARGL